MQSDLEKIKAIVQGLIPDSRVILFGSRARNTHDAQSDYDLMVVIKQDYNYRRKLALRTELNKIFGRVGIPVDVLMNSENEIESKGQIFGHIVKTVLKEGVEL